MLPLGKPLLGFISIKKTLIMRLFILLLVVVGLVVLCSCGDDDPPQVIVLIPESPRLPKINCEKYLDELYGEMASRGGGIIQPAGRAILDKARIDCFEENKRRGY